MSGTGGLGGTGEMSGTGGLGGTGGAGGPGGTSCFPEDDNNACTEDFCENGLSVHVPSAAGAPCTMGGILCDGMGACVECLTPTDCPSTDTCTTPYCMGGVCGTYFTSANTPVANPTVGDCMQLACDGIGHIVEMVDDSDHPPDDGIACTIEACIAGVPAHLAKVCNGDATCVAGECVAPACTGTVWLPGPSSVVGGGLTNPTSMAAGDLNGDNKPDLVLVNGTVSVFLNQGNGSILAPVAYTAGTNPAAVTMADFNGDGKLDLAVTSASTSTVSVLLNQGNGTFAPAVTHATSAAAFSIVAADLNGDGAADLAMTHSSTNSVSVLLNQRDGTFTLAAYPGATFSSLIAADMNGDGATDLVVTNRGINDNVSIFLNQGDGTFAPATVIPISALTSPDAVVATDLDSDGKLDLAVTDYNGSDMVLLFNQGNGSFTQVRYDLGGLFSARSIVAADFDNDGKPDLAVLDFENGTAMCSATVLQNKGNRTFGAVGKYPVSGNPPLLVAADLSGDGKPDLAFGGWSVDLLINRGDGAFLAPPKPTNFETGAVNSLVVAEFTGDDKLDVAVSTLVAVYKQQDNGDFVRISTHTTPGSAFALAGADLDGDGREDLAFLQRGADLFSIDRVGVLLKRGNDFAPLAEFPTGDKPQALALADLNGDGKPDLVVDDYHNNNHTITVSLNQGNGSFGAPVAYPAGSQVTYDMATADLNGDGRIDVVLVDSNRVNILYNLGGGVLGAASSNAVGMAPRSVVAADLNGDGKIDLVTANASSNNVSVLLNMGNGSFAPAVHYAVGYPPRSVSVGDLNSDGKPDLVVTCPGANSVRVLFNQGGATFGAMGIYSADNGPQEAVVRDLNGDGRADLVIAHNDNSRNIRFLFNTCVP